MPRGEEPRNLRTLYELCELEDGLLQPARAP